VSDDFLKRRGASVGQLQSDLEGTLRRAKASTLSEAQAYAPSTVGDWASPPPKTVQEALDRLAAVAASPP